jgi:hypothetical protein
MEFTGTYWRCIECGHIWDYNDTCPNCGEDIMLHDINPHEVLHLSKMCTENEAGRLINMLHDHGDYNPF